MKKTLLLILPIVLGWNTLTAQTPTGLTPVPASIVTDVPEAANYGIVYHLDIPLNTNYANAAINYAIDHANELNTNHSRVAYYLELDGNWVWVSMDDFASGNLPQLGIPRGQSNNVIWELPVNNMNIFSNKVGVTTGQNISTGNIEMWSQCYVTNANSGIGGDGAKYDFDDETQGATNCYGSFQVHNNGAQQTLFAFNRFPTNSMQDLGIGNNPNLAGHSDWTFEENSNVYTTRKLYILVGNTSCNSTGIDVQTACDSYTWIDGNTYTASNSTATHTLINAASCDSIVTLNLTINNSTTSTDTQVACDTYTWIDGNTYTASNSTATHTLTNAANCDSIVTLNLTINNSTTSTDTQVACDTYTWIDGNTYTSSNSTATFTSTNAAGCDNVATLDLTINNSTTSTDTQVACDTYTWIDGNTYTSSNSTATFTSTNAAGCDNVATLNLTINNSTTSTDTQVACDTYTWIDGNTYTTNNTTATHTSTNAAGCNHVTTLNLTINSSTTSTDTQVACDTYTWIDGNTYTASNSTATHTLTNAASCDSIVTLNLTINNSTTSTDTQVACDTYTWIDGNTYTVSNTTATHTLTNAASCDSVITLNLTINNSTTSTDTQVACDSYTWLDGVTYTSNNTTATFTSTNAAGCDNVATLNLTINNSTTSTDTQVACDSYTWLDGVTYTSSNSTATFTSTNAAGCDNIATLNLTINNSVTSTDTQVATDSYTWIDGNTYTANNTTATYLTTTVNGCDSLITLNLIINTTTSGTDVQIACDSLVWIDGNTYTADNTTAMFTLVNMAGVDSIVTLNLTINNSTTATDVQTACDSYTWIDGNTYTISNNVATYTLPNATGCDSLITLDLTINTSDATTDVIVVCDSLTWIDGITYTMSNTIATHVLTNLAGCDSIITLDLTITDIDVSTTESSLVISANNTTASSYQWIDCSDNSLIVGETNTTFTATQDGEYAVIITEGSCSDTSDCVMIAGVGIDEEVEFNVSIYPNPNQGEFTIQTLNGTGLVNIYTIDGKFIKGLKITELNQLVNLGDFERGVYFVNLIGVSNQKTIRLVVD